MICHDCFSHIHCLHCFPSRRPTSSRLSGSVYLAIASASHSRDIDLYIRPVVDCIQDGVDVSRISFLVRSFTYPVYLSPARFFYNTPPSSPFSTFYANFRLVGCGLTSGYPACEAVPLHSPWPNSYPFRATTTYLMLLCELHQFNTSGDRVSIGYFSLQSGLYWRAYVLRLVALLLEVEHFIVPLETRHALIPYKPVVATI